MNFDNPGANARIDPGLQRFIQQTSEAQKMQTIIHELTEKCWDSCVDKPGSKMDGKTENCIKNCVERFIDTNIAVTQRLEQKATDILRQHDSSTNVLQ